MSEPRTYKMPSTDLVLKKTYLLLAPGIGRVKIGCSADPLKRMLNLRKMNAVFTESLWIGRVSEIELHRKFKETRHHGEWFTVSKEMVEYFHSINEAPVADRLELELNYVNP